jgi:glycosidase
MKIKNLVVALSILFFSCQKDAEVNKNDKLIAPISDQVLETAVIYEANIRQYSKEGTFKAFTKDIPVLKELGVKVIWLMPINPISEIKRKATDGSFTSEIEDKEERKKYLGSYYSVSDYKAINPEFGNKDDFKALIDTAHNNGIYVIVDWVPNHTGWDHPWITNHPDWYTQNEKGEIIDPINPDTGKSWGWTDTADLNYDNLDMQQEMIKDLKYWVKNFDIDGYRMDVAHKVPPVFFNEAITELKKIKPIFMLAEAEQHELFRNGFDMQYAWEGHHILNSIAKGEATVSDFDSYMNKQNELLEASDFNMNFVTNHDENSWSGTVKERMGEASEILTTLVYTMPGMPLVYSGQEYDLNHRLKFFEKDSIPKTKGATWDLLAKLGDLKNNHIAFHGGKKGAAYQRIETNNDHILIFKRTKGKEEVYFVGNLSEQTQKFSANLDGISYDLLAQKNIDFVSQNMELTPWEYYLLSPKHSKNK